MNCRDIQRAIADVCFFGERDGLTGPHLDHLSSCRPCRDEVGLDRSLVRELHRALSDRVEAHAPSENAWRAVLLRTQAAPPIRASWRDRLRAALRPAPSGLAGRLRTATAVSSVMLVAVMANGQNIVPTLPAVPVLVQLSPGDQFERSAAVPSVIHTTLIKPDISFERPVPPLDAEQRYAMSVIIPRAVRSLPIPEPPIADEEELAAEPEEEERPPIIWQLRPPTPDGAASVLSGAAGEGGRDGGSPPIRGMPGEPT